MVLASGVSAQPKFANVPLTVAPCAGVSIAPNGFAIVSFANVIVVGVVSP